MSWNVPPTQTAGQPATASWANLIGGDLTQINTLIPLVSGGLSGATASGRFVGFTNGNAPTVGTFLVGDFAFDISTAQPRIWACVSAGSPGGWAAIGQGVPTGTVVAYTSAVSDPAGWLLCDGRAASRTTYAALYALLVAVGGTDPYGTGDGSTTFNLPDLRGRTIFGADNMGTSTGGASRFTANNTLGATGQGEFAHTLTIGESPNHGHALTDPNHSHTYLLNETSSGVGSTNTSGPGPAHTGTTNPISTGITIANSGGGTSHNIIPLNQILNFIVKT